MTAVAQVSGLTKSYGGTIVLEGIDLELVSGSTTAIVGSSGCGKTTLLRLIAGFERPDSGSIVISGQQVSGPAAFVPAHRRTVGYVAQDGGLFPHLTVGQNIAYGLRGTHRRARIRQRVTELLTTVALEPSYASRRPHELSGGQQQRVALARALARQPKLMLLDEPFSALDAGLRASTRKTVADLLTNAGVTTLVVTHDQEEAMSIADRVAVMRKGQFTQVGSPREVYRHPVDRFTAEFLGECVIVPCTVSGSAAECVLGSVPIDSAPVDSAPIDSVPVESSVGDGAAMLMLRPEQLIASEVADSEHQSGAGTVVATEFLGHDVLLTIDPGGDITPITVRQSSLAPPAVDTKVHIDVTGCGTVFR